eukprot:4644342-Prymnesium_polylepis.1
MLSGLNLHSVQSSSTPSTKTLGGVSEAPFPGGFAHVAARIVPSTHLESGAGQFGRSVASEH